jgi:hypothetical protein
VSKQVKFEWRQLQEPKGDKLTQQKHLEIMINAFVLFPNKKSKKLEIKYNKQRLKNEKLRNRTK